MTAQAPSTAPGALDSLESRRFFQQRLALVTGVLFVLFAAASGMSFIATTLLPMNGMPTPIRWWGPQVGALLVLGGAWMYCRGDARPAWILTAIDALVPIKLGFVVVMMIHGVPTVLRPELGIVLGMTHALVARAALVPSTAARSAIIGALAWLPPIIGTYQAYAGSGHPLLPMSPVVFAVVVLVWASLAVVSTAVTSRVIYGLHQEARVARHLGQYTLDAKIGEGGMGVVYRARHAMLRRPTAIKLLSPDRAGETDFRRFEREVQLTSQLTHPNTVAIYDYGRTGDGVFYYAMEYLDGVDLEALVRADGPQPPERVIHILCQICGALAEAHGVGLIHRDIKPANVLLCARGAAHEVAKVVDFGLVKNVARKEDVQLTQETQLTGTPLYLSPEAIAAPEDVDASSDLYAVGALAYFLVTGKPPFEGKTVLQVCAHHVSTAPVAPSERLGIALPHDLERLILACLAKSKERRPESAAILRQALQGCSDAGRWDRARAVAWWAANGERVKREREQRASDRTDHGGLSRASTIAVDLRPATSDA